MAHRLRQTSLIFRQVEILLAHRRSKWTNSEALSQISCFPAQKPRLAQKQQHKQQQQQQTKQQTIAKPFQNLPRLGFDWLQF